ncbi:MAG: DEAD/DEAH box helicase [Bacteroidia bacterium]|nr:DEAD/DEAH box helicase [Bacteroidia bacterium]
MRFEEFNLNKDLMEGIASIGFETATPIQEKAIPVITSGKDLIACAQTGTGKTAAFLLPILSRLTDHRVATCNTLVLVPTRELALQIDQALDGFSYFTSVSSIAIYGGTDGITFEREKRALTEGANVIIATPGRLIAHINQQYVKFGELKHLVLDEADRMLDMGFQEDILKIISHLPKVRQTLLFSATMPPEIRSFAKKILNAPEEISIAISKPAEKIRQEAFLVHDPQKNELITRLLKETDYKSVLIFCSRKEKVKVLRFDLKKLGLDVDAIHSDREQHEREETLRNFSSGRVRILIATDILSRGIDIENIELVINYDVPPDAEDYIHRIGRTARAERTGRAITFINGFDQRSFQRIERLMEKEVPKLPMPQGMAPGPVWDPSKKPPGGGKKSFHRGGKKSFRGNR